MAQNLEFDPTEVIRSAKSAWQRWHDQTQIPRTVVTVMEAAS
jgi:hypothetical protein